METERASAGSIGLRGHIAGLTSAEAAARLNRDGPNRLPVPAGPAIWRQIAAQVSHFFALLLWAASALAFFAGMPQLTIAIILVILINGLFSFFQEYRAERAAQKLRDLLPRKVTVIRDGSPLELDAEQLVSGDLVVLQAGDKISADMLITEATDLLIDTSTLTGESEPAVAESGQAAFAGTFIVEGEGRAEVTATGQSTRLAGIAKLTRAGHRPLSPLAKEMDNVVRIVAIIAVGVGVSFLVIALLVGIPPRDGLLFAIGVMVALVPEGLLPTITLALAVGAQRMAGRHALVRRLEAVETLGSTTFICTDKTGTLTMNQMAVVRIWTPAGMVEIAGHGYDPSDAIPLPDEQRSVIEIFALAAARCSQGQVVFTDGHWSARGDPMDAAISAFARRLGLSTDEAEFENPVQRRFPFDARRRRMSVIAGGTLMVKGAPDSILPRCGNTGEAAGAVEDMANRALRVIAVACRRSGLALTMTADQAEDELELLGIIGLEDPPRPHAAQAIADCRAAGIKVAMITGDLMTTATAIANEIGLLIPESRVVDGTHLPDDDAILGALLDRDGTVVSRVTPEDKLRIARALRMRGHVVAMTGDGVNDGPALQEADIGIAMGLSGTDVAREAADLVLLDDDFATIIRAVEYGRATYANVRRFLTYHLTDNVAELTPFVLWALSGGRFPLAIGVLQVLCLDIGTDILPALALGAEAPTKDTLRQPPRGLRLIDGAILRRVFGVLGPAEAIMEIAAFLAVFLAFGWRPGESFPDGDVLPMASGAAFSAVIFGQMANAFVCRSTTQSPWVLGWFSNRFIVVAVLVELLMLAAFLYVTPLATILGQTGPSLAGWAVALLAAPAVILVDALHKLWLRRFGPAEILLGR